jgi:hypothetical protein
MPIKRFPALIISYRTPCCSSADSTDETCVRIQGPLMIQVIQVDVNRLSGTPVSRWFGPRLRAIQDRFFPADFQAFC